MDRNTLKEVINEEYEVVFSDVRASFQWAGETNNRKAAPEKITAFWEAQSIIFFISDTKSNQKDVAYKMFGTLNDHGGRRSVIDRRRSSSANHFPERRYYRFRRSESDRRIHRIFEVIRKGAERREASIYI